MFMVLLHLSLSCLLICLTCFSTSAFGGGIVINEVMADPVSESTGEFVEIYNAGDEAVDLAGWVLGDLKDQNDIIADYTKAFDIGVEGTVLNPGQYALIVDPDYKGEYNQIIEAHTNEQNFIMLVVFGDRTLGNGLGNSGDFLYLERLGERIDTFTWLKSAGGNGISWEKKQHLAIDSESNRAPSKHSFGATPAFENSTVPARYGFFISHDGNDMSPQRYDIGQEIFVGIQTQNTGFMAIDSIRIHIVSDATEGPPRIFQFPINLPPGALSHNKISWTPRSGGQHSLSIIAQVNTLQTSISDTITLAVRVLFPKFAIIMNEIMFNPGPDGPEWVELYNRSNQQIDIEDWSVTIDRNGNTKKLVDTPLYLPEQTYLIIADDSLTFKAHFPEFSGRVLQPAGGWHRLRNSGAQVQLYDLTERLIHEIAYVPDWSPNSGQSAERVNVEPVDDVSWGPSAAQNGGSPGTKNTLFSRNVLQKLHVEISPNPFSPDGDGQEDACLVTIQIPAVHGLLTATVFDVKGRYIKTLANQLPVGSRHTLFWFGKDDKGRRLPTGPYIVYIESLLPTKQEVIISKQVIILTHLL